MAERLRFWWKCVQHLDRRGHWPKGPKLYGEFFLCERCNRPKPRRVPRISISIPSQRLRPQAAPLW